MHGSCSVHANVLLQHKKVGELLAADGAVMHHPDGRLGTVDAHVSLQVTFSGETTPAYFAPVRPLPCVDPVVHLKCAFAAENPVTDDALIGVRDLLLDVLD